MPCVRVEKKNYLKIPFRNVVLIIIYFVNIILCQKYIKYKYLRRIIIIRIIIRVEGFYSICVFLRRRLRNSRVSSKFVLRLRELKFKIKIYFLALDAFFFGLFEIYSLFLSFFSVIKIGHVLSNI